MKKLLFLLLFTLAGLGAYAQNLGEAQAAIEAEKYEKARNILESLAGSNPDDGQYQFHLGDLYLTLGEDALAKKCFEQGVAMKKNGQINYVGLGRMLLDDGKPEEAAAEFEKATYKIKGKDVEKYLYIAKAYYDSFNPDYAKSAEYAKKVVAINPNLAYGYLILGDAEYKLDNLNEAYMAYRNAFSRDNKMLRGKLNLAVITKDAHAFPEAVQALDEIIALDAAYGPTYRELAEIYYLWATLDRSVYDTHIAKALGFYEKYMELTDYSLESRMRHADFLVLAKDYEALEREAAEMQKIDKVNPRILRYLGYSAYENGNYTEAAEALTGFLNIIDPRRALGMDYIYLGRAEMKLMEADGIMPVDPEKLNKVISAIAKAVEKDALMDDDFSGLGIDLYKAREYGYASQVFGALIQGKNARLIDWLYYSNSIFYNAANMDEAAQAAYLPEIEKADSVYALVIEGSPTTQDTYYNRARLNRFIPGKEEKTNSLFEEYINITGEKGEAELSKPVTRRKLSEAYTSLGAYNSDIDVDKAVVYFEKALELEPENEHAIQSLEFLKKNNK